MKPTDALSHPSDWTVTTVAEAIELKRGISWSKEQECQEPNKVTVPVIRISNVQDRLKLDDVLYITGVKKEALINKRVTAGWSILVGSNGNRNRLGNAVLIDEDTDYLFASFLVAARPKQEKVLKPQYFYRWLSSDLVQARLSTSAEGSTGLNNLSHSFFRAMQIPVPRISEQEEIAQILDAADTAIERTKEAIDRAKDFKKALVQRIFQEGVRNEPQRKTDIGLIPTSWKVVPLKSVVSQFQYGISVEMHLKGKYPILRMGNIQSGEVLLDDLKYVDLPEKIATIYQVHRGDVLFNRTNSQEHVGKVGIYRSEEPAVFASYLIRLLPDFAQIDQYYLGHLLSSYSAQCRIKRFATPGVQQVNINAKNLGRVLIPIPIGEEGIREQKQIAEILEQAEQRIRSYEPVLCALEQLKKALMHDLLTGKVRVNMDELTSTV